MGKHLHKKPEPSDVRGLCVLCKTNLQKKTSRGKFQALCNSCENKRYNISSDKRKYIVFKRDHCERCGPQVKYHYCQLDVDHVDGDHKNNIEENYQTLCANCHRLKTWEQRWSKQFR